jgi:hypothetical protein
MFFPNVLFFPRYYLFPNFYLFSHYFFLNFYQLLLGLKGLWKKFKLLGKSFERKFREAEITEFCRGFFRMSF